MKSLLRDRNMSIAHESMFWIARSVCGGGDAVWSVCVRI